MGKKKRTSYKWKREELVEWEDESGDPRRREQTPNQAHITSQKCISLNGFFLDGGKRRMV